MFNRKKLYLTLSIKYRKIFGQHYAGRAANLTDKL